MRESLDMLAAAHEAGVTEMVCTPHARDPYFDYCAMLDAFDVFRAAASEQPEEAGGKIKLTMGFEVNLAKFVEVGFERATKLGFRAVKATGAAAGQNSEVREFLLELPSGLPEEAFDQVFYVVRDLQDAGFEVIIAHPERYWAIQDNLDIAFDLADAGCKLQASADFMAGGREGGMSQETAMALFDEGLYSYIASDAHRVHHYELLSAAMQEYASLLI